MEYQESGSPGRGFERGGRRRGDGGGARGGRGGGAVQYVPHGHDGIVRRLRLRTPPARTLGVGAGPRRGGHDDEAGERRRGKGRRRHAPALEALRRVRGGHDGVYFRRLRQLRRAEAGARAHRAGQEAVGGGEKALKFGRGVQSAHEHLRPRQSREYGLRRLHHGHCGRDERRVRAVRHREAQALVRPRRAGRRRGQGAGGETPAVHHGRLCAGDQSRAGL
mmetsp:Transcript_13850/g.46202  ORF Transcript_13850/g.46202 Transcript_13850/m.46202 type:complete len:221 (-) Transcript_13850:988-1650(-)